MTDTGAKPEPPAIQSTNLGDWVGLGDLVGFATERLTAPVEGMHRAIADRWFGLAGPPAEAVHRAHDSLTAGIYGTVRATGSLLGRAVGSGAAVVGSRRKLPPLWMSPRGRTAQAVINATWGDELEHRESRLATQLGLRDTVGAAIEPTAASLAAAIPDATRRLAVLLHGLGETEGRWRAQPDQADAADGLAEVLAADGLFTPLTVRYNSGRRISDNGASLAALLEQLVTSWPVAVEEIALVGHSMGGLIARSSFRPGNDLRHRWPSLVRHVVAVGSPHFGAPLEKGANLISLALRVTPESRPIGDFLDLRSAGIKDLRFGSLLEEDSSGRQPAVQDGRVDDIALPEDVELHLIAGVVTAEPTHPVGAAVGDLMVRVASATGRGRRRRIQAADVRVFGKRRHSDLASDPAVHEQILEWLTR